MLIIQRVRVAVPIASVPQSPLRACCTGTRTLSQACASGRLGTFMASTLKLLLSHGNGLSTGDDGPLEYRVLGLPPGQVARIRDFAGDYGWRILRFGNGVDGLWQGSYPTAEAALAALQAQLDAGR